MLAAALRALLASLAGLHGPLLAQGTDTPLDWHLQSTSLTQWHPRFGSPYAGANSLPSAETARQTFDTTLFLGIAPWRGAEAFVNPEIDQGHGLGNTLGLGGFSSGDAYKVGHDTPYGRLPRAFLRQTVALEGPTQAVESTPNVLAGARPQNNITLTLGKFSVVDVFDTNRFAHDPRADFSNWAVIDGGAFDYAADAWGYTVGAALEWNQDDWSARTGWFALSRLPNGTTLDWSGSQHQWVAELEHRHEVGGRAGTVRLLVFDMHARLARYDDAVARAVATGGIPDPTSVRTFRGKTGLVLNGEQELTPELGAFARWSVNDGRTETFDFTDVNRSLAAGLSWRGSRWGRPADTVGLALAHDALSAAATRYLAAGGLGVLVGDGRLPHPAVEQVWEGYYAIALSTAVTLTLDLQSIRNPAYNADRGPVTVAGLRLHVQF